MEKSKKSLTAIKKKGEKRKAPPFFSFAKGGQS